jgi:hypothetical protein
MRLPDNHIDELHLVAVQPIQLLLRQNSAAGERSGIADEVQQYWLPAQVAKPHPLAIG